MYSFLSVAIYGEEVEFNNFLCRPDNDVALYLRHKY